MPQLTISKDQKPIVNYKSRCNACTHISIIVRRRLEWAVCIKGAGTTGAEASILTTEQPTKVEVADGVKKLSNIEGHYRMSWEALEGERGRLRNECGDHYEDMSNISHQPFKERGGNKPLHLTQGM